MTKANYLTASHLAAFLVVLAAIIANPAHAQSGEQLTTMLARADSNGDGSVSWAEFSAMRSDVLTRLDRNGDGFVDSEDRPRIMASRFDQAFGALVQADANGDGRISRAEVQSGRAPAFDTADTDNNRVLSAGEIAAIGALR